MTPGVRHCLLCEATYAQGDEHVCDTQPLAQWELDEARAEAEGEYYAELSEEREP